MGINNKEPPLLSSRRAPVLPAQLFGSLNDFLLFTTITACCLKIALAKLIFAGEKQAQATPQIQTRRSKCPNGFLREERKCHYRAKKANVDCHSGFSALQICLWLSAADILYLLPSSRAVTGSRCL